MASTKLSADDRKVIVQLYQAPGQTAATVAEKYGVSVSTISRLLKSELPAETYEALVRQKRGGGETRRKTTKRISKKKPISKPKQRLVDEALLLDDDAIAAEETAPVRVASRSRADLAKEERNNTGARRPISRRRRDLPTEESFEAVETTPEVQDLEGAAPEADESTPEDRVIAVARPVRKSVEPTPLPRSRRRRRTAAQAPLEVTEVEQAPQFLPKLMEADVSQGASNWDTADLDDEVPENSDPENSDLEDSDLEDRDLDDTDLGETEDELDDEDANDEDTDDDDFEDAFDDDDFEEDDEEDKVTSLRRRASVADTVKVLPLADANLARMLYLVIDRTADLITLPLQHFSDLGQLPPEEEDRQTLPVFENHRVARRFSQRNQRVIKVPDGEMISKTAPWLEAKGITRCLLEGQVYSLESADPN